MSDTETRAAERGDDEAAALVAYRRTHDPRACPVCGWAGKGLAVVAPRLELDLSGLDGERVLAQAYFRPGRPINACGRCGVTYVEDAAGLSLECMEFDAARRGETT